MYTRRQHFTFFSKKSPPIQQKNRRKYKKRVAKIPSDLSQTPLLEKINTYLKKMKRKNDDGSDYQIPTRGYCHGLTLLFLEKMAEGKVQWFYDTKRKIIECEDDQLEEMELEIEKFISKIEWAQNPEKYNENIAYNNVDLILDTQPQQAFDSSYTFAQLKNFLTYKQGKGNMICITNCCGDDKVHTVGVFTDGIQYHLYDSNYESGRAVRFRSSNELSKEILNCLYTNLDRDIPSIPQLEIKVINRNKNNLTDVNKHNTSTSFFNGVVIKQNEIACPAKFDKLLQI